MYKFPEPVLNQLRVMYPSAIRISKKRTDILFKYKGDEVSSHLVESQNVEHVIATLSYTQEVEEFPAQAEKLLALYGFTKDLDRLVKQHIERGGELE